MRTWEMIQDTQARKNQSSSFQITLSRYEGWANEAEGKKWIVLKKVIRLSIREVFCVSYQELRSIHCKRK